MEKPSKKEESFSCHECGLSPTDGWNACHDAMSTWLEGEVPTVESILKLLLSYRYVDFGGEGDADSEPCENAKELAQTIHALLLRKLTGKV